MDAKNVVYVVSESLAKAACHLPSNTGRSAVVHSLANALGFFQRETFSNLQPVRPSPASHSDLCAFHDPEYIDFLLNWSGTSEEEQDAEHFGLEHDCPYFPTLKTYVRHVAGAVITAVNALKERPVDIAIVWDGGRHHASKSQASGYCYVNDCNIAILNLRKGIPRPKILYVDLDLHYSDGVSEAFQSTSKTPSILTLSVHYAAPGFFPVSDRAKLTPLDTDHLNSLSIPLLEGASNATFERIWLNCVEPVKKAFKPDFVIIQCGVDGLAGDPCAIWNVGLDIHIPGSLGWMIRRALDWDKKTLLLGGGGYNSANAARAWAYLTSVACGCPLSLETGIPHHASFPLYAPSFTLDVAPGNMIDRNTDGYLAEVEDRFMTLADVIKTHSNSH